MSLESLPPGYPGKFFVAAGSPRMHRRPKHRGPLVKQQTDAEKFSSYRDGKGNFPSRATVNSPSTEVVPFFLLKDAAALTGVAAC